MPLLIRLWKKKSAIIAQGLNCPCFYALHGRRFAPEAPQRSEDLKSVTASAVTIPSPARPVFSFTNLSAIRLPDGRRRKNLSATKSGHMPRRFYSHAQCHIWYNQCRIDNHGQNVNILSMIVQKRCFCLCLPQALLG